MKKLILTVALAGACTAVFAQGKVNLIGDGASLITLGDATSVRAADVALAGQAVGNAVQLPSGVVLEVGLYAGTSSTSLSLAGSVLLNTANPAGTIPGTKITLTGIAGIANNTAISASTPWFQVRVWDSAFASYALAVAGGSYNGAGALFQMNPGPSIAYVNTAPPSGNSTWTDAPIIVSVPEPSTFALVGLGAAALMIFRRRS